MTRLTIEVLGGLDIRSAGTGAVLELPTRKSKAFLAYLALSPGMLRSREHLAGTFWDRSAEEQARASLRQTLSSLRRALPKTSAPLIDADSESIWLDAEAVDVDAVRFDHLTAERSTESLERAASLYRGELLSGFSLVEEHFEHWLAAQRRRLQEVAVHALSELVGRYARADQIERGIAIAERLLVLDPLLEWAHASLMRLYARGGRREAALRQYQECARILSRELGIAPAEETKRLAAEIGSESHGGGPADSAPRQPATQSLYQHVTAISLSDHDRSEPLPVLPAERKQLSVLCARIREGDSTDPESVIARIDPALKAIVDSVRRFGGTVSSVQGDGVTALFGAPYAQEDHAVRACYAALAIRDAVSSFVHKPSDMRIGIHAGEAIVRTVGDENLRHYEPVGPMVQIANHIGAVIAPGEIGLTADATRRAEGFIETSGPATKRFDGASEPIELFMLHAKTPLRLRWDARSARPLTQFVGRNAEVNRLHELLERAARGSGQVAAILGEPGMGKSRLAHEFVNSPSVSGWTVLETGTVFYDTSATYLPLANLLRTWFEISERDAQAEATEKLRRGVEALDPALASIVPALAAILDLPPADAQWSTLSPVQQRQRTLQAMKVLVLRASQPRPLILLIEDLHWIDAGTQALLDHLVDSLVAARVLLLLTHRPEYRHEWFARSHFSQVRLDALGTESADRLLQALVGADRGLASLRKDLIERTDGTPLFLEESVRALVDAGALVGHLGAYRADRPIETFEIPSTVQAVLASRIDGLAATQKSLLQTAAVIGRDVPLEWLLRIAGIDRDLLLERLASLQSAEFLYQTRLVPEPQYTFKHALTHRVAYESILRERRRAVHTQVVDVIEGLYADRLDEHVELLAHHALGGEQWLKALHYVRRSAAKAIQRSAHLQAIQYLDKGLRIIEALPASTEKLRYELDYQKAKGVAMMAAKGWAAKEVLDAYTRARELCEALHDDRELFIVLRGEGQYRMIRGESKIARKLGDRCAELIATSKDVGVHIETHHLFWTNSFFMGDYADADFHCTQGMALYERDRDHALTYVYSGHDPGVCCRCFGALVQCLYGYPDRSLALCRETVDLAQGLAHPLTTALAYWACAYVHILRGEPAAAKHWAEREIAVCEDYLLPLLLSQGIFQHGWALGELGHFDEGIARMREGIAAIGVTGAEIGLPYYVALLGEALGKAGKPEAGLDEVEAALASARERGERFQVSEMLCIQGKLLTKLSKSRVGEAEALFRKAITAADKQGAKLPKLRATTSLARLLAGKGEPAKACALLQPALDAITEGRDLSHFRTAAAQLEQWKNH